MSVIKEFVANHLLNSFEYKLLPEIPKIVFTIQHFLKKPFFLSFPNLSLLWAAISNIFLRVKSKSVTLQIHTDILDTFTQITAEQYI
jgi:hypothetical protein